MRVGIVGIGWWSDVLAGVIARTDKLELRAGYSRSADKTAKFAETFGCEAMSSYEEMLALDDLDGVILTTPNSAHRLGTEAAAAAGKHVFVEKPVSDTIADGRAMIAACEAANVVLAVGHSYRRHGALRHLKKMIDDGLRVQKTGESKPSPVDYPAADHLLAELEDFADAAAEGRKPEIDGTDALNPLAVVLGTVQSPKEGRSIALSEILGQA